MANEKRLIEYINREEVCNLCDNKKEYCGKEKCPVYKAPTVDAVEVVHGHWINGYNVDFKGGIIEHTIDCSVCDSVFKDKSREVVKHWKEQFKVCPFCGAIMDGGNEEA